MSLESWIDRLQKEGRYSFERTEALQKLELSKPSLKKALQRASYRGRILPLRRDFYVIVPLEYSAVGAPPTEWFLNHLMTFLGRPYYVGGLSAAAWHGAAHQRPQEMQVVVPNQLRNVETRAVRIRFLRNVGVDHSLTQLHRTQTGDIPVSTPEWTALDLIRFQRHVGGMDAVATVLTELMDALDPDRLAVAGRRESTTAYLQRLGWLLDSVGDRSAGDSLHVIVAERDPVYIPLNAALDKRIGSRDSRWRVIVNEEPEADL
ncbi:type IV toxin-antitoxin system AbiEi family antitoxin [Candidatus Bipolaricaulota bacterium]|nr:type IV toxin-antitoxin system AbiEi family antitoxin [Candidatus Bipolaricaulota bacterium]